MDAKEGMACRGEHQTSVVGDASGPEVSSLPIKLNVGEWIKEIEEKLNLMFTDWTHWPFPFDDETKPKICKFTLHEEISRPRLVEVGEFPQPSVVPIGPFHRQKSTSISNEKKWISNDEKWKIVYFMNNMYDPNLSGCVTKIKNQLANASNYYSDLEVYQSFDQDEKSFAEMLLLDSYFILFMLTVKIRKRPIGYTLIPIISNSTRRFDMFRDDKTKFIDIIFNKDEIAPDLLILDNQIPFIVIEELFKELKPDKPLHEYALEFFETIHPRSARHWIDENSHLEFLHLLDLFHWSRVPENKYIKLSSPSPQQLDSIDGAHRTPNAIGCGECAIIFEKKKPRRPDSINWARHTPNATELRESATMFEKKTSSSSLDITFRRRWFKRIIGVLDIPELHIRDYSSFIFHNLIAFEMQPSSRCRCTMAFSALMRNLLQNEEDVKLLRQSGILASSSLNDSKLVYLFKCLGKLSENH